MKIITNLIKLTGEVARFGGGRPQPGYGSVLERPPDRAPPSKVRVYFCFQFHTGKNHGTKFIHTIIWWPGEAVRQTFRRTSEKISILGNKSTANANNNRKGKCC